MAGLDKKKVTEYLNRVTHKYDKDGRIMPFEIQWNPEEASKYEGLTMEEKKEVCILFCRDPINILFSDVYDIRDFPVLLKDAVYSEKTHFMTAPIPKKDIAPSINPKVITSKEGFNDAFMNFIAQRDELVKPKDASPLQLDIDGFIGDESYTDYQSAFSKETIYTSQVFEVKPILEPVSYEDAMKRYQNEIANPAGVSMSMTEAEAATEFNRIMKEKQDAFDSEKAKYNEKIGDNILELAKARDAAFIIPNYAEDERKKAFESMMHDQEEMKQRIEQDKQLQRKFLESISEGTAVPE